MAEHYAHREFKVLVWNESFESRITLNVIVRLMTLVYPIDMMRELQILHKTLSDIESDEGNLTELSGEVFRLRHILGPNDDDLFLPFIAFYSETDAFPLGDARAFWSAEGLAKADGERFAFEALWKSRIQDAAARLNALVMNRMSGETSL